MKSANQNHFAMAPQASVPRSKFTTTAGYKTTLDAGILVPFYADEALPGDTFSCSVTAFSRLNTPAVPFMDNLYMDFHFFAVPVRLVWDNFVKMMGERRNPDDSIDYLAPVIKAPSGGWTVNTIADYLGFPAGVGGLEASSLWHRAYNLIWNEWFRDENLQNRAAVPTGDGPDNPADFPLRRRCKRHDYFTSCLPWPQKGDPVQIPLGTDAPVFGTGAPLTFSDPNLGIGSSYRATMAYPGTLPGAPVMDGSSYLEDNSVTLVTREQAPGSGSGLYCDLTSATAATVNALRQAFQIQRLLERDARGGTRYTELIRSHFGVTSPDARMQRPEYLGGGSLPIQIHAVAQTSSSDGTTPQGNLAATGATGGSVGYQKSFTEHCVLLGFVSVRADLTYQYGLPRMFSRRSRYDWYWPVLSNLGEQAVLNKEIYAQGPSVLDDDGLPVDDHVFGYQERWAEYRYGVSKITGKLRSRAQPSLDVWHLAQKFTSLPKLNSNFIEENPPIDRVVAVPSQPAFLFDSLIKCTKVRPMPMYSIPGMMDHF